MNLPLKYANESFYSKEWNTLHRTDTGNDSHSTPDTAGRPGARAILDASKMILLDRPSLLEDHLCKIPGVLNVEINAFSSKIAVEFDPTLVSLDTIKRVISSRFSPSKKS